MSNNFAYVPKSSADIIKNIINNENSVYVISGASLSYNRYDFDPQPKFNAYECYPGLLSWSFMLRDALKQNDKWFVFGHEIDFLGCDTFTGITIEPDLLEEKKYLAMNHGKIKGLIIENPQQIIKFKFKHSNSECNRAILHMQKRDDLFSCSFDIYVDNQLVIENISNKGNPLRYQGFEPFEIELPITGDNKVHDISIRNIRNSNSNSSIINITGIGTKKNEVYLTGRGNQTIDFFIENIDERILNYKPDVLFHTTGANDRARLTETEFHDNLVDFIQRIKNKLPACEVVLLGPPFSEKYSFEYSQGYIKIIKDISTRFSCSFIDLEKLFDGIPVEKWRFDNVHMTKFGNTILARKIIQTFFPDESYYRKSLVDAEVWFN